VCSSDLFKDEKYKDANKIGGIYELYS